MAEQIQGNGPGAVNQRAALRSGPRSTRAAPPGLVAADPGRRWAHAVPDLVSGFAVQQIYHQNYDQRDVSEQRQVPNSHCVRREPIRSQQRDGARLVTLLLR